MFLGCACAVPEWLVGSFCQEGREGGLLSVVIVVGERTVLFCEFGGACVARVGGSLDDRVV